MRSDREIIEAGPINAIRAAQYAMDKAQASALKFLLEGATEETHPQSVLDELAADLHRAAETAKDAADAAGSGYWRNDLLKWGGQ